MTKVVKKAISGEELCKSGIFTLNIKLPKENYVLVTGIVLNPKGEPLPNCAITISKIYKNGKDEKGIYAGLTFCDEKGVYGVSLPVECGVSYEFKAYCSI